MSSYSKNMEIFNAMEVDMTLPAPESSLRNSSTHTGLSTSTLPCDAPYSYAKSIRTKSKREATTFARTIYSQAPNRTLAIWIHSTVSADLRNEPCAIAVGYNMPSTSAWNTQVTIVHYTTRNEAGLLAIGEALRVAISPTITEHVDSVLIFSDARHILKNMRMGSPFGLVKDRWLLEDICRLAGELDKNGVMLELHWVPIHARVEGHQRVRCCSQ